MPDESESLRRSAVRLADGACSRQRRIEELEEQLDLKNQEILSLRRQLQDLKAALILQSSVFFEEAA
jgi:hypothetical protein